MKTIRAALAIVAFALFLAGCAKDTPVDNGNVPDVTDGRITVVNDESKLNTRVTNKNDSVQVDAVGLRKTNGVQAFSMTLVA
jgi:hypothetical protein